MNPKTGPYHIVDLPAGRRIWVNTLDMTWPAHTMYGLLEVDVTVTRRMIADHKERTGEMLFNVRKLALEWVRCGGE